MKLNQYLLILCAVTCLTFSACKKDDKDTQPKQADIVLNGNINGQTVSINKGQTISITLGNPGDGNYYFDPVIYTSGILTLNGHAHKDPTPDKNGNVALGNFGTDTWTFTAAKTGTAAIEITATQPKNPEVAIMFNGNIEVK